MPDLFEPTIFSDACISPDLKYRYWLTRTWDADKPVLAFCMLNPSTADASKNDPTIRRCIGFAKAWGYGGIVVVNLFALRATDPAELTRPGAQPIAGDGEHAPWFDNLNDAHLVLQTDGKHVAAAWGCHGTLLGRNRQVMKLFRNRLVECLWTTKDGHPKHPVRLAADTTLQPFMTTEEPA